MTEEKALELFARCYTRCDFTALIRRLHRRASYEAYNRFYRSEGREDVTRLLTEKAVELRALPRPDRTWRGYLMSRREFVDLPRCDHCVVLTKHDPAKVIGVVRIRCTPLSIREIRVLDPAKCDYTRGEPFVREGT